MKIGVLGAGQMADALVPHWLAAGHEVAIGGRTASKARALADRLGASAGTLREAAEFGDVVLLAVRYAGIEATLRDAGAGENTLTGKVLIDCSNPVELESFTLDIDRGASLAELIAAGTGARVVKALNLAHADVWRQNARYNGQALVVPIAGEEDAKPAVATLVCDAGGDPLDAGGLDQAHNLEASAAVIIRLLLLSGADLLSAFQLTVGARA